MQLEKGLAFQPRLLIVALVRSSTSWLGALLVLALTGLTGCASLDQPRKTERVSVKELIATPAWFDGRLVVLSGRASGFRVEFSRGQPTNSFQLDDGTQIIEVRTPGGIDACQLTRPVTVEGWFRAPGRGVGFGSIEAIRVGCQ
jgi:hypothetical protein